jgi:V/A-type H+-transporting ATPase subunit D
MIQPTRTNLLLLKDRARSVSTSIEIMRAKRQALIKEFLNSTLPFLRSRKEMREMYGRALGELSLSLGAEGGGALESISAGVQKEPSVRITEENLWGIKYRDVEVFETAVKNPLERDYDYRSSTHHLEECMYLFEKLVDSIVQIAAFESRLKRLAEEIVKTTRRTRMLEERVLPRLKARIKGISQYIEEREREAYYRLKRAKGGRAAFDKRQMGR